MCRSDRGSETEGNGTSLGGLYTVVTARNDDSGNGNVMEHWLRVFGNRVLR